MSGFRPGEPPDLGSIASLLGGIADEVMNPMAKHMPHRLRGASGEPVKEPSARDAQAAALAVSLLNPAAIDLGRRIEAAAGMPNAPSSRTDEGAAAWPAMGEFCLMSRLSLAMRIALAEHVHVPSDPARREGTARVRRRLLAAVCGEELDGPDPQVEARLADWDRLLAPVIETERGPVLNHMWTHPAFLLPTVAALAQFWDCCLTPDGDSLVRLAVQPAEVSLFGLVLHRLTLRRVSHDETGAMMHVTPGDADRLRVSTLLGAAAQFCLLDEDWLSIGASHLTTEVDRAIGSSRPSGSAPSVAGSSPREPFGTGASELVRVRRADDSAAETWLSDGPGGGS